MAKVYKNEWAPSSALNVIGFSFVSYVFEVIKQSVPEYFEFSPFKDGWKCQTYQNQELFCLRLEELITQIPNMGEEIKDEILIKKCQQLFLSTQYPSFIEAVSVLGESGYSFRLFTYVGKVEDNKLC